jgi:hypothetical protein
VNVITCGAAVTEMFCDTGVAAAYVAFPACVALIVHVPAIVIFAVVPVTVQIVGVVDAKLTVSPELAVAVSGTEAPINCAAIGLNVMVCGTSVTEKLCETVVAAAYVALPACAACSVQVPTAFMVAVVPATVQIVVVVEVMVTVSPELAVAVSGTAAPITWVAIVLNVIV